MVSTLPLSPWSPLTAFTEGGPLRGTGLHGRELPVSHSPTWPRRVQRGRSGCLAHEVPQIAGVCLAGECQDTAGVRSRPILAGVWERDKTQTPSRRYRRNLANSRKLATNKQSRRRFCNTNKQKKKKKKKKKARSSKWNSEHFDPQKVGISV